MRSLVQTVSNDHFGPLIAYLVPGATALWGFSLFSPTLAAWFAVTPANAPTISGFLYLTLASLAVGMTITAVWWAIVDQREILKAAGRVCHNFGTPFRRRAVLSHYRQQSLQHGITSGVGGLPAQQTAASPH